ncbi:MAG: hypothetical protein ACYC4J_00310 [Gemmatimonadaceae bacterium]
MHKKLLLALGAVALAAMANAFTPQKASAGSWAYVCCGDTCPIGDACSGSGTYTCCKEFAEE